MELLKRKAMSSKTGAGTVKTDSNVIEMPKHMSGDFNPYNRVDKGKGKMPKTK